jgi:hypothetical protein
MVRRRHRLPRQAPVPMARRGPTGGSEPTSQYPQSSWARVGRGVYSRSSDAASRVGRDTWPTYEEFERAGAKGMRDVIGRIRGVEWWAREMDLPGGERRRGGVRRWDDETITAALTAFVGDRRTWPPRREFEAAGLRGLREVLREHGGVERWATRMGVELPAERRPPAGSTRASTRRGPTPPVAPRRWPLWDDRRIESELRAFLTGRVEWPRYREFVAGDHKQLYHAVLMHGGTDLWAARLGVQRVNRQTPPSWSEERVRRELASFLEGRSDWPTGREFQAAGRESLLRALRRFGGREHWQTEFGLAPVRSSVTRASQSAELDTRAATPTKVRGREQCAAESAAIWFASVQMEP